MLGLSLHNTPQCQGRVPAAVARGEDLRRVCLAVLTLLAMFLSFLLVFVVGLIALVVVILYGVLLVAICSGFCLCKPGSIMRLSLRRKG